MPSSNCCFLTYIQVFQEAGKVVWYSHLFQNFPQFIVIHIVKGFGVVNKAEVDIFHELSCFFFDLTDIGNLISGSSEKEKAKVKSLSHVRLCNPWTVAYQAPLSMGFSRQEYWNGLPFPSSGDLPDPGIESGSPALLSDSLPLSHQESHKFVSVILVLKTCRIFPSPFTHYPDFHLSYGPFQFWCPSSQLQSVQSNFFEF